MEDKRSRTKPEKATLIQELVPLHPQPLDRRSGCETWSLEFSPDGSYFAWSMGHGIVKLVPWPLEDKIRVPRNNACKPCFSTTGRQENNSAKEKTLDCGQIVWSLAFGPRGFQGREGNTRPSKYFLSTLILATGLNNGFIKVWDVKTGNFLFCLTGHQDVVRDLAFAPNGGWSLVSASRDKTLHIWNLTKGADTNPKVLKGHTQWVYCCRVSPNCSMIASVSGEKYVFLWSMRSYTFIRKLEGHRNYVISCDFSPDGALLITAAFDHQVRLWDPYTGKTLIELCHYFPGPLSNTIHDVLLRSVRFSPEGLYFATVAEDRDMRIWALGMEIPVVESPDTQTPVTNGLCCVFHPHGGILATGTRDGHVQFWCSPMVIPSLRHLCRQTLRNFLSTHQVLALPIPTKMKDFLTYRSLTAHRGDSALHHSQEVISLN
ncbi:WD repeat and SOCS box-containing protein 2 isoform X2 [Polypterus senegalus]|uniref:WD repeat and SOCS box-containing protein 2 isoform X2 n=1 Tax=Polypterus senegalus TaxID=55291 RepID=UPI001962B0C3|nr:WD repeat and SOCS box-containing protein 2 isoform X2 [Polypterus senegalus]